MRGMRRARACLTVLGFVAALAVAGPSRAQYIYIDTNGDGINTWADSLNSIGTTAVDIWINTGFNRNGSRGGCAQNGLTSFSLNLHAVDGTINWGTFTSAFPPSASEPAVSNPHEYHIAVGLDPATSTNNPLGLYRLGTLNVEVASGNPCIEFATSTTMSPNHSTSFGAGCPGPKFDHTNRLGPGWSDWDGLTGSPSALPRVFAPGIVLPKYLDPVVVDVQAALTNCGPITSLVANLSALPPGNNAVFTTVPGNTAGTLTWQPTTADQGDFFVTFRAAGKNPNSTDSKTTIIHLPGVSSVDQKEGTSPVFALWPNRPNPFNPATTIRYSVPAQTHVRLIVYDVSGRAVARLVDRVESPGQHEVHWLGENDQGQPLASGVYACRLTAAFGAVMRRLVLAR